MNYARATPTGIVSGAFRDLWPRTSASDEARFAQSEGYGGVLEVRAFNAVTEALESCPVYLDDKTFYSVRVVPVGLDAVADRVTTVVQERLDAFAQTRDYDSILSATTYASSGIPSFASDGKTAIATRDATWSACNAVLEAVKSGARAMPTLEQLLKELPALGWPK